MVRAGLGMSSQPSTTAHVGVRWLLHLRHAAPCMKFGQPQPCVLQNHSVLRHTPGARGFFGLADDAAALAAFSLRSPYVLSPRLCFFWTCSHSIARLHA